MKNSINKIVYVLAFALTCTSCEPLLDENTNINPNNPVKVPISAQMPSIQINLADVYGGEFSRFNCMLTQQVEGVNRCYSNNNYTGLTPANYDVIWQNVYENVLNEIKLARISATEGGFNHYLGILNIMEAFIILTATDVWDNIPYSEALQGINVISPAYDAQASIYDTALSKLNKAITQLNGPFGNLAIGQDDVFYAGNTSSWVLAAHAIKARTLLKLNDYSAAMAAAQASFTNPADNMAFQYPDASAAGQWYRFNRDRAGDVEFHPQMAALMNNLNDVDRVAIMNPTFITTHPYMVADFLQELITYREIQFIIAEVDVRNGGTQIGYDAYINGIQASFTRLGLDQTAFDAYIMNTDVAPGLGNLTLDQVMTQKYIAMFLQPEVYSDWRRTDIPNLTPVTGPTIPVRWHYSSDEYQFNTNSPEISGINVFTDKVGWDD